MGIKNVLRSFFDPDSFPGQVQRLEAFDSLVKKIDQEMERTNQEDKLGVMRYCQSALHDMSTSTLIAVNESFPSAEDGLVIFIRFLNMNNKEDIKVAAHYRSSGLVHMFSAPALLSHIREALNVRKIPRYAPGSLEHEQILAVLNVGIAAAKQGQTTASKLMTPELAKIIMQHPDRADDIIRLSTKKNLSFDQLHPDLLLDYLNADSKPLAEGIL